MGQVNGNAGALKIAAAPSESCPKLAVVACDTDHHERVELSNVRYPCKDTRSEFSLPGRVDIHIVIIFCPTQTNIPPRALIDRLRCGVLSGVILSAAIS